MKRAFTDLIYGFGVWIVLRFNREGGADLLEDWARALRRKNSNTKI